MNEWLFNNEPFNSELIKSYYGFVYRITNLNTGRQYIGRKYFYHSRKWKKKDTRRSKRESDWKDYWSSCEPLKNDVKTYGVDAFKREILVLCTSKGDCNTVELHLLWKYNVLEDQHWYNEGIGSRKKTPLHIISKRMVCEELYDRTNDEAAIRQVATAQSQQTTSS